MCLEKYLVTKKFYELEWSFCCFCTRPFNLLLIFRAEDADRGMDACHGKMFLGSEMNISLWHGMGVFKLFKTVQRL